MAWKIWAYGIDSDAQSKLKNEFNANQWLGYAAGTPETVIARAKSGTLQMQFATSGTWSSPGDWTTAVTVTTSDSSIPADDLSDAIDADIKAPEEYSNVGVILVKCTYTSGDGEFEAKIDGNYEDYGAENASS